jgi:hypothetical protein
MKNHQSLELVENSANYRIDTGCDDPETVVPSYIIQFDSLTSHGRDGQMDRWRGDEWRRNRVEWMMDGVRRDNIMI